MDKYTALPVIQFGDELAFKKWNAIREKTGSYPPQAARDGQMYYDPNTKKSLSRLHIAQSVDKKTES